MSDDFLYKAKVKLFGHPLNSAEDPQQPFYIIGSGRSGSTLLRRLLYAHEDVYIPGEIYTYKELFNTYLKAKRLSWKQLMYVSLAAIEYHHQFHDRYGSLGELALELNTVEEGRRNLAEIVHQLYHFLAKKDGKPFKVWGDKTPQNTFILDEINAIFPQAKYIHIIRNGLDVALSYVENGLYDTIEQSALRWQQSIEICQQFSHRVNDRYIEIRYEDLVTQPESEVKRVCDFLGIDFREEMITSLLYVDSMRDVNEIDHHKNVKKEIFTQSIGKGRKKLNDTELEQLTDLVGTTLHKLKYDD